MTFSFIIFGEIVFTLFIVWCFLHEDRLVAFEDKAVLLLARIYKKFRKAYKIKKAQKINEKIIYTPVKPVIKNRLKKDSAA